MKKLTTVLAVILAALMLCSAAAAALDGDPLPDGVVYAVMTMDDGTVEIDGAPSADELSGVDSYELICDSEPALEVNRVLGDLGGRVGSEYFSVTFDIPGTNQEVFLTGLIAEYVEELQGQIISGYTSGADFDIERLSFIDTEKTYEADGDDQLCWAASTADILTYTGWAAQAGFDNEDDVFEALIASYTNDGSNATRALTWFFNGSASGDNSGIDNGDTFSYITDYPNSGGYLRDYAADTLNAYMNIYGPDEIGDMFGRLRFGCGISLGLMVYTRGESTTGGHAVTLWGYSVDKTRAASDPERYISIFFTDSDSDEVVDGDRRDAPNIMSNHRLVRDSAGYFYFNYDSRAVGYLDDYTYLLPYTPDTPRETDPEATRSKATDPDLAIRGYYLTETAGDASFSDIYESGAELYFMAGIINNSDVDYSGRMTIKGTVTDSSGKVIENQSRSFSLSGGVLRPNYYVLARPFFETDPLPAGDYTVTYTINPVHILTEAYYYNNTVSRSFKVRDSYLLGDFDGSGDVGIMDVTAIQRVLAAYDLGLDEEAIRRGDVNGGGLGILDANMIQRWLADIPVSSPINAKRLYD